MNTTGYSNAVDFLPDALAIRHAPLPWWGRCLIGWIAVLLFAAVAWACIGRVDVIVTARGKLVSNHPTIVMKPLERTVIKEILVAVGDRVRHEQVLATFDPVFSRADAERLLAEVNVHEAHFERLLAEFKGTSYTSPSHPTEEAAWQESIFTERRRLYAEKMEYFSSDIARIEKAHTALEANLVIQRKRLDGISEIEAMLNKARMSRALSLRDLMEVQLTRMQYEADISDKENNLLVLASERLAKMAARDSFKTDWSIEVAKEMIEVRTSLTRARKEYEKALQMTSYVALRAPQDAVVHEIAPIAIESAVREAEPLITLVPVGGAIEVEAKIRAEDIGKVHTGARVRVKISAFPFQQYGTLNGAVRVLSEDAFSSENAEKSQQGELTTFYRARISLDAAGANSDMATRLIPGMEVQAEILVDTRRIIQYLTNPIIKSLDEAIREP